MCNDRKENFYKTLFSSSLFHSQCNGTRSFTSIDYHVRCVYSYNLICKCGVSLHSNCNVHLSTEDRTTATTTTLSCNNIQRQQYDEKNIRIFVCHTQHPFVIVLWQCKRKWCNK